MAAANASVVTVKLLVSLGANLTSRSVFGHSPLHVAVLHQHQDVVEVCVCCACVLYRGRLRQRVTAKEREREGERESQR